MIYFIIGILIAFLISYLHIEKMKYDINIITSKLKETKNEKQINKILLALVLPLYKLINLKINKNNMKKTIISIVISLIILPIVFTLVITLPNFYNHSIVSINNIEAKLVERDALYDKVYSEIQMIDGLKTDNNNNFKEIVNIVMSNRKDSENVTWKWLQEQNPTSNYNEVSDLYKNLVTVISNNKKEFYDKELEINTQTTNLKNYLSIFPNNLYNKFFKFEVKKQEIIKTINK